MPSIYKNKNTNKWDFIFDYYLGGKRKQVRRRGFKTKREANDKLTELQNEVQQEEYVEPSKMTVSEYMREWLESREGKVESVTLYNHGCYIRNHIDPNLGEYKLQELNPIVCQKFIDGMSKNGYAYNTIERVVTILKIALDRAVHFKIIKNNNMRLTELPMRTKSEINVWDLDQVNEFLEYMKDKRFYSLYSVALMTGMRQGEILGLRWKDVDFDKKLIYVRQILTHYGKEFKTGSKTSAGNRTISISDNLVDILKVERKKVLELKMKNAKTFQDHDLVFCANNGNRIFPSNLTKAFQRDIKGSGLPRIRFHDMRHTHATLLIQQNVNVKVVSERLGHSKISMTLDTYSHVLPSMQQEAADKVNEMFS